MRRGMQRSAAVALGVLVVVAPGCPGPRPPNLPDRPTPTYSTQWTPSQREQFYHLAEGSEVIPTNMIVALWNPITDRPILAVPERFGLIYDPANPELPVGVTSAETVDTRLLGIKMTGFNCAACHVAQVAYRGQVLQVDGAGSAFNTDTLADELTNAIEWTLANPIRILEYLERLRQVEPENPFFDTDAQPGATQRVLRRLDFRRPSPADSSQQSFLRRLNAAIAAETSRPGIDQSDGLGPPHDEPEDRAMRDRYNGAPDSADLIAGRSPGLLGRLEGDVRTAEDDLEHFVNDVIVSVRLLIDRLRTLAAIFHGGTGTTTISTSPGAGRVDAFDVARNLIFVNDPIPTTAPVDFPWLWNFPKSVWLHYDGNTNSLMQRNMGQAIGVGAVWDRHTYQSTLNPINIYALENLARSIDPPQWPAMFPPLDSARFRRGERLYTEWCATCHYNGPDIVVNNKIYSPAEVGTDSMRVHNFGIPVRDTSIIAGKPSPPLSPAPNFTTVVGPILSKWEVQAFRTFNVPAAQRDSMSGCPPVVWETNHGLVARPLSGIWASAPYLHNGSVRTLYDLLLPAAQRPDTFFVGNPEYDPVHLGFVNAPAPGRATFVFRTDSIGNSNSGHEYGTQLPEPDRMALLEYLKGHTLPKIEPTCPPGPRGVPVGGN